MQSVGGIVCDLKYHNSVIVIVEWFQQITSIITLNYDTVTIQKEFANWVTKTKNFN